MASEGGDLRRCPRAEMTLPSSADAGTMPCLKRVAEAHCAICTALFVIEMRAATRNLDGRAFPPGHWSGSVGNKRKFQGGSSLSWCGKKGDPLFPSVRLLHETSKKKVSLGRALA